MSELSAHDREKCRELAGAILNVAQGVTPAAALIFATATEHIAGEADEGERTVIAALLIRAARHIDEHILDSRH